MQFWNDTLSRFNEVSKSIQKADVNLAVVIITRTSTETNYLQSASYLNTTKLK